jgi:hypothetical protein
MSQQSFRLPVFLAAVLIASAALLFGTGFLCLEGFLLGMGYYAVILC